MNGGYQFNASQIKDKAVAWIRRWFAENGSGCNAVIGISGGKDSTVVAALCVEALGKDRVIGVIMPNVVQPDIEDAWAVIRHLGIRGFQVPVTNAVCDVVNAMDVAGVKASEQTMVNLPARMRMATLYAVSQTMNGRVANTCKLSENYIGYLTRYGDGAGDFSPLGQLTCTEVVAIGRELGLPDALVNKVPSDGLCGKTDEDNFGFTYQELDQYIRYGRQPEENIREKIDALHRKNIFKLMHEPTYQAQRDLFKTNKYVYED